MSEPKAEQRVTGPVRVVDLRILDLQHCEALFGPLIKVDRCRLVFIHMLPVPAEADLLAVQAHGLVLSCGKGDPPDERPQGILVPWAQVAYVNFE